MGEVPPQLELTVHRAYTSDPMIRVNSLVEVFGILEVKHCSSCPALVLAWAFNHLLQVDPESAEFGSQVTDVSFLVCFF